MDENLIEQIEVEAEVKIEVNEIDVPTETIEYDSSAEEVVYEIPVEIEREDVIDVSEGIGWVGGDNRYHDSLLGTDLLNQHPISAITGLRAELDEIERLKTVESDGFNTANYYKWLSGAYDTYGYFVSITPGDSTIKICGGSDIFGVTVSDAGFVGGQVDVPRDGSYGLVVTSGLVDVRCELDVEVGDYVVSNYRGCAEKSSSNYGYKVLATENKHGIRYAVIMLGVQADVTNDIGVNVDKIERRVSANEKNIVSAINVANQAYNKSIEASISASVSKETIEEALLDIIGMKDKVGEIDQSLISTSIAAAQAKAIADSAAVAAESARKEALDSSNNAIKNIAELKDELKDDIDTAVGRLEAADKALLDTSETLREEVDKSANALNALSEELQPLAKWPLGSDNPTGITGFVARADEDSAILASITKFEGDFGEAITGFVQEATDKSATVSALASYKQTKDLTPKEYADGSTKTYNGIKYTVTEDGDVIVTGTATGESRFEIIANSTQSIVPEGSEILISGCPAGGSDTTYWFSITTKSSAEKEDYSIDDGSGATHIATPNECCLATICIGANYKIEGNLVFKPRISYVKQSGVSGLISQVDENKAVASISASFADNLAGIEAKADENTASLYALTTSIIGEYEIVDSFNYDDKDTNKVYYSKDDKLYWYYGKLEDSDEYGWLIAEKISDAGLGGTAAGIQSIASSNKAQLDAMVSYDKDKKSALAGMMSYVDEHSASIGMLAKYENKDSGNKGCAGFVADVNDNTSTLSTIADYTCGTDYLPKAYIKKGDITNNGITYTIDEYGKITANGTATAAQGEDGSTFLLMNESERPMPIGTKMKISGCPSGGAEDKYYLYFSTDGTNYIKDTGEGATMTVESGSVCYAGIKIKKGIKVDNVVFDPCIESIETEGLAAIKHRADKTSSTINSLAYFENETKATMANIEQKADANGAYIQSTVANVDKYSVGPLSQADGFTLEQASSVFKDVTIYAPTERHTEKYMYSDTSIILKSWNSNNIETNRVYYAEDTGRYYYYYNQEWVYKNSLAEIRYERTFTPGYLYKWGELESYPCGWITVDKDFEETTETDAKHTDDVNNSSMAVYFGNTEIVMGSGNNYAYWYTNATEIYDSNGNTDKYVPYTLYKWDPYLDNNKNTQYQWVSVATLAGNSRSRAVSQILQTANKVSISVADITKSQAEINVAVEPTESSIILSTVKYVDGVAEKGSATLELKAGSLTSNKSSLLLSAKNIALEGYTTINKAFQIDEDGYMYATKGGSIAGWSITSNMLIHGLSYGDDGFPDYAENSCGLFVDDYDGNEDKANVVSPSLTSEGNAYSTVRFFAGAPGRTDVNNSYTWNVYMPKIQDAKFKVLNDGSLYASAVKLGSGNVGSDNSVFVTTTNMSGTPNFFEGSLNAYGARADDQINNWRMTIGSGFGITSDGTLYAKGAKISGEITAETGSIAGFSIADGQMVGAYDESGCDSFFCLNVPRSKDECYLVAYDNNSTGYDATFKIDANGRLYAKNAEISGKITATEGDIGAWKIYKDSGILASTATSKNDNKIYGIALDARIDNFDGSKSYSPNVFAIGYFSEGATGTWNNANFRVKSDGTLVAKNADISNGTFINCKFKGDEATTVVYNKGLDIRGQVLGSNAVGFVGLDGVHIVNLADQFLIPDPMFFGSYYGEKIDPTAYSYNTCGLLIGTNAKVTLHTKGSDIGIVSDEGTMDISADTGMSINVGSGYQGILNGTWYYGDAEIATTSWRGAKVNIEEVDDRYSTLFDELRPVRFIYSDGQSKRYHTGFILDELKSAMDKASIDTSELAAYCISDETTGEGGIRYSELIPINTAQIQKLKPRVTTLEKKVQALETENEKLKEQINLLLNKE